MPHRRGTDREGGVLDVHQALEVLGEGVEALQPAVEDVGQDALPVSLHLAGHDDDGLPEQRLDVRLLLGQHVDGPAGVEATHQDVEPVGTEFPPQVQGPGKLVGLDPDQPHHQLGGGLAGPPHDLS